MSDDERVIRYAVDDRVATIIIDRPAKRGAMTYAILADFHAAIARAGADETAHVVVLTGTDGSFCAGTDLSDLADTPEDQRGTRAAPERAAATPAAQAAQAPAAPSSPWPLVACPKPVIAAVGGAAVGMGAEFTTQCDIRIASTRARFGWNFVQRGLVPDTGAGSFLLPRIVGPVAAMRLLFSGEIIDAAEAERIGFVTQVVEPDELAGAARAEAERYLSASPFAVRRVKALVYAGMARAANEHVRHTAELLAECFHSDDHREGVAAFLERREARFTGR